MGNDASIPNNTALQLQKNLNPTQQADLDQLNQLKQKQSADAGNTSALSQDKKDISALEKKMQQKDGFTKTDMTSLSAQWFGQNITSDIAANFKSGGYKPGDTTSSTRLQADYQSFLKAKNFKASDDAWNQFSASIKPQLQGAGLSDADISKSLDTAKKVQLPQPFYVYQTQTGSGRV